MRNDFCFAFLTNDAVFICIVALIECYHLTRKRGRERERERDWLSVTMAKKIDLSLIGNIGGKYHVNRNSQFSPWFPLIYREFMILALLVVIWSQYCTATPYWIVSRFDENSRIDVHTTVRIDLTQVWTLSLLWLVCFDAITPNTFSSHSP